MKPNFALSLSFDGLRLMHRVSGGWHLVGEVALDEADLSGSLERLRSAAEGLEPDGISTKLLIPNDQIKYIAIDTTRAEVDDVREALHGATPYTVDELVYDFTKGGGRTYVAAVAKETLNEARQFATEHGFNPISFAAVPEPFTYVGEAFFGAVEGQTVERDDDSVVIIGDANVSIPQPEPEAAPEPVADETPVEPEALVEPEATPEVLPETLIDTPEPEMEPPLEEATAAVEAADVEPNVVATEDTLVEDAAPQVVAEAENDAELPSELEELVADAPSVEDPSAEEPVVEPPTNEIPAEDDPVEDAPAPMFASRLRADRTDGHPVPAPDVNTNQESGRTEPTFSRQTPASLAVPTGKGTDPMPPLSAPSRGVDAVPAAQPITTETPDVQATAAEIAITGEAPTALSPDAAVAATPLTAQHEDTTPAPSIDTADEAAEETSEEKRGAAATAIGAASAVGGAVGGMFASRRMARAEAKEADTAKEAETTAKPDEKSRLTVFGARKQPKKKPKVVVGGKPRFLGLILTAVLLLFLLAFAAFAALSEEGIAYWFGFGSSETQIAADPADPTSAPEVAAAQTDDAAQVAASDAPDALAAPTALAGGQVLTPEEAARIYAATGVWQRAPRIPLNPRTTSLDGLTLTSAPTPVVRVPPSPLASGSSVAGDAVIATPIDPPPPSQQFDFNEEGLVVATAEGAVTPDGILVIIGRPALNPPTRPGTVAPVITPQDQLAAVIPEEAAPIADAPEGVIVIAGRPAIEPPIRSGTAAPAPAPEAETLATGDAPLVATDGLLVLAGSPSILPPVRPGTVAPTAVPTPEVAPEVPADVAPVAETPTTDAPVDGLNVIAGSPPILPPARPGTVAPQETIDSLTQDIASALGTSGAAQTPTADTRRPTTRPASIQQVAVAVAEAAAAANTPIVGALTADQAAGFRPRTRPAGLAPAPTPDPEPEEAAVEPVPAAPTGLQIAPEIAAAVQAAANRPNPIVNPTAQAVPSSSRPDTRPRNMDRIVARAAQTQQRAATQVAAVAPRTVAPSGPTAGSVAQAATLDNAINLREVNLIGIYGGSGDRRALIRMSNGRYLRVTVGDRLDGGRVTAISASSLSYTKRGRPITLQVPG